MGDRQGRGVLVGLMAVGLAAALAPPGDGRERGAVTGPDIGRYVEVRQFAQEHDPGLATILRSPDVEAERARLKPALDAVGMPFDRFAEIHRVVLADPDLRARVEAHLARSGVGPGADEPAPLSGGPASPAPSPAPRASPK